MRRIGVGLVLLVSVSAFGAACAPPPPPTNAQIAAAVNGATWVQSMLSSINAQRAGAGVGPLRLCGTLQTAAQAHSDDQAATNTMTHSGSNGSTLSQRAEAAGYTGWTQLGENVATGYTTIDAVMNAWMNSPGHRANLLNGGYTDVGLAESFAANGAPYWTQDFGASGAC